MIVPCDCQPIDFVPGHKGIGKELSIYESAWNAIIPFATRCLDVTFRGAGKTLEQVMSDVQWDEDSNGNVILHPLVGAVVADFAATTILLRLEYQLRSETGDESKAAVQLAMRPEEAIRLAKQVLETAQRIFTMRRPEKPN
jgi:hypothetical protein